MAVKVAILALLVVVAIQVNKRYFFVCSTVHILTCFIWSSLQNRLRDHIIMDFTGDQLKTNHSKY